MEGMIEIMNTVVQGNIDDTRFQRLQRVALETVSNILDCGRQYHLILIKY